MSKKSFEKFGELANMDLADSVRSGRYRIHAESEPYLIKDIISKLELLPTDRLLEIGCGPGNLLISLSFMVRQATGIDHPNIVKRLKERFTDQKFRTIGANFLDYEPESGEKYEKILVNSVLGALKNRTEAIEFVKNAAQLLVPGGRLLLGDLANVDKKKRFVESEFGKSFSQNWQKMMTSGNGAAEENQATEILREDDQMFVLNDEFILELLGIYRRSGWEAYCLPQPANLPFGHTREDILIKRLMP